MMLCYVSCLFFFFFQAEDGIRDLTVTGVQTCALPICPTEWHPGDLAGKPNEPPQGWRGCVMFGRRMTRLRWIDARRASLGLWDPLVGFAADVQRDGVARVVVCGMGGSSLVVHVLAASFKNASVSVLDSTDPAVVLAIARAPDLDRTLFVISSKSGDRKSTRLNSSHSQISYAVFCLKKKKKTETSEY